MKPYRSMLFVPGHKPSWADKGLASGTDALILDLEDSVPAADKDEAREVAATTIDRLHTESVRADVWVRPNASVTGIQGKDLEAVVRPGLTGLFLPKVFDAEEVKRIDAAVPRISSLLAATGPSADVGRDLGFEFTPTGLESLYLRSRLVLAASRGIAPPDGRRMAGHTGSRRCSHVLPGQQAARRSRGGCASTLRASP